MEKYSLVSMVDHLHYHKCQFLYKNLIDCLRRQSRNSALATLYIREFDETKRCDDITNFSPLRKELELRIDNNDSMRLTRIRNYSENSIDEKVAAQACLHFRRSHEAHLLSALNLPYWLSEGVFKKIYVSIRELHLLEPIVGRPSVHHWLQKRMSVRPKALYLLGTIHS